MAQTIDTKIQVSNCGDEYRPVLAFFIDYPGGSYKATEVSTGVFEMHTTEFEAAYQEFLKEFKVGCSTACQYDLDGDGVVSSPDFKLFNEQFAGERGTHSIVPITSMILVENCQILTIRHDDYFNSQEQLYNACENNKSKEVTHYVGPAGLQPVPNCPTP